MKKYARIVDNIVWEVFIPQDGVNISDCFTPELVAEFIECPSDVEQGWDYKNGEFIAPVVPPNEVIIVQ